MTVLRAGKNAGQEMIADAAQIASADSSCSKSLKMGKNSPPPNPLLEKNKGGGVEKPNSRLLREKVGESRVSRESNSYERKY